VAKEFSKVQTLYDQYAALCWRRIAGLDPEFLVVTSRETSRWILPKGWPISGLTPAATAAREAFEEAGAEGIVTEAAIGSFVYDKMLDRNMKSLVALPCEVGVFALEVTRLHDDYPEKSQRIRSWVSRSEACVRIDEPSLCLLIARFMP
jgi:8-oxo-dGTP pyrophosphatase MutT (NUDIX family)